MELPISPVTLIQVGVADDAAPTFIISKRLVPPEKQEIIKDADVYTVSILIFM